MVNGDGEKMSDNEKTLANVRELLQSTSDAIENVIKLEVSVHQAYEELMGTAKAVDIAGLYRPNIYLMIQGLKEQKETLDNFQFSVECNIKNNNERREKSAQDKWEECIIIIPQKDEFRLQGIENWHISLREMVPNSAGIHKKSFREEAYKLMAAGFPIAFNTDYGVGGIHKAEEGFVIELWQDVKKTDIYKKTLDEVLDWIIYFYDSEGKKQE